MLNYQGARIFLIREAFHPLLYEASHTFHGRFLYPYAIIRFCVSNNQEQDNYNKNQCYCQELIFSFCSPARGMTKPAAYKSAAADRHVKS